MPIALGYGARGEARRPWALWWSVVGGLLFSQLVTLSLTPGVLHLHVGRAGQSPLVARRREAAVPGPSGPG